MLRVFWLFALKQACACLFGGFVLMWLGFVLITPINQARIRDSEQTATGPAP